METELSLNEINEMFEVIEAMKATGKLPAGYRPGIDYRHSNGKYSNQPMMFDDYEQQQRMMKETFDVAKVWAQTEYGLGVNKGIIMGSLITGGLLVGCYFVLKRLNKSKKGLDQDI